MRAFRDWTAPNAETALCADEDIHEARVGDVHAPRQAAERVGGFANKRVWRVQWF